MNQKIKNQHLHLAQHNGQACDYLNSNNRYFDWVITSAFYAALHYVSAVIFPLEYNLEGGTETAPDLGTYRERIKSGVNKHRLMIALVYKNCHGIGYSYRALLDMSYAARYETTCHARLYSDKARRYMAAIKAYCVDASDPFDLQVKASEDRRFQAN